MELKPCPFCGNDRINYHSGWRGGDRDFDQSEGRTPSITCDKCCIYFSVSYFGRTLSDSFAKEKTCEKWNARA